MKYSNTHWNREALDEIYQIEHPFHLLSYQTQTICNISSNFNVFFQYSCEKTFKEKGFAQFSFLLSLDLMTLHHIFIGSLKTP